jgi:hypothetical protein
MIDQNEVMVDQSKVMIDPSVRRDCVLCARLPCWACEQEVLDTGAMSIM